MRIRHRVFAASAAIVSLSVPLVVAVPAEATSPACSYVVNADNVPIYLSFPPPRLPIITTASRGDVFINPGKVGHITADGTKWRHGFDQDIPDSGSGWVNRKFLTLTSCVPAGEVY